ncbi:MAG: prolyl oligopeptidase family serine peptidase [Ktedonobacteraceae bacterium]
MQHHVTPETNLKDIRSATDANISPDGKRTIFVVSEWVPDKPKQRSRIWMVDTAGGDPRPLTNGPRADTCPRWSPNGQHIAFLSRSGGEKDKAQLHLISSKGGEAKQLCSMPNGVSDLSWSPNGSRIAFLSLEGNEPTSDPKVFQPGTGRHQRLWTVRVDSDTPEPITPDGQTIWQYAWSPDGKEFAVYYAIGPDETDWYRGQIGLVSARGGAIHQLTQLTRQACALTWSPDGTRLGYISGEWSDPDRGGGDIYVLSLQDGATRNLTPSVEYSPTWCRWFPDGRKLLYVAWDGVSNQLGIVNEANGEMETLFRDFIIGERFWPHLSTTPDLQHCVFTHSDRYPPDVWYGTITLEGDMLSSTGRNRLTYLNPLHEDTLALAPTERIRYASTDGWQIDALLTLPLATPETPKSDILPPLIVNVHGGPSGCWLDDWDSYRTQLLATAGYAVLRANVRGSMGRGVAFADAVVGDMGGKDFQDILNGVDYLVQQGLVDGERVGIMGWSYGGFMVAWAVTQTTRFKAAIMGAGVCDFHSFHAQSNIPDWDMRFLSNEIITPSQHPAIYRARSAITYVQRVTTPTLIVHGESDPCVPVNQAYEFYRALCENNVPTELVVYPREGHGLSERDHLRDYQQRILKWFEKYV